MKKICEITANELPTIEEVSQVRDGLCPVCEAARIARKAHESVCGHGTFCRDGMYQLFLIPEDISMGQGSVSDLGLLKDCCEMIIMANECELSVHTAQLVKTLLEVHYDEWYDHLTRKRCKAMECPAGYALYIDPAICNGCGKCASAAPDGAVAGGDGRIHVIKKDLIEMKNSGFISVCPVGAIKKWTGAIRPMMPTDPVPVGSFGNNAGADGATGGARRRRRG